MLVGVLLYRVLFVVRIASKLSLDYSRFAPLHFLLRPTAAGWCHTGTGLRQTTSSLSYRLASSPTRRHVNQRPSSSQQIPSHKFDSCAGAWASLFSSHSCPSSTSCLLQGAQEISSRACLSWQELLIVNSTPLQVSTHSTCTGYTLTHLFFCSFRSRNKATSKESCFVHLQLNTHIHCGTGGCERQERLGLESPPPTHQENKAHTACLQLGKRTAAHSAGAKRPSKVLL